MGWSTKKKQRVKRSKYTEQNGQCYYCGKLILLDEMTFDHRIPKSKGGKGGSYNIVLACGRCNRLKGNKTLEKRGIAEVKVVGTCYVINPEAFTRKLRRWAKEQGAEVDIKFQILTQEFCVRSEAAKDFLDELRQ